MSESSTPNVSDSDKSFGTDNSTKRRRKFELPTSSPTNKAMKSIDTFFDAFCNMDRLITNKILLKRNIRDKLSKLEDARKTVLIVQERSNYFLAKLNEEIRNLTQNVEIQSSTSGESSQNVGERIQPVDDDASTEIAAIVLDLQTQTNAGQSLPIAPTPQLSFSASDQQIHNLPSSSVTSSVQAYTQPNNLSNATQYSTQAFQTIAGFSGLSQNSGNFQYPSNSSSVTRSVQAYPQLNHSSNATQNYTQAIQTTAGFSGLSQNAGNSQHQHNSSNSS